jgi:hypothetical protein
LEAILPRAPAAFYAPIILPAEDALNAAAMLAMPTAAIPAVYSTAPGEF